MTSQGWTSFSLVYLSETDAAICFVAPHDQTDVVWLPKSTVDYEEDDPQDGDVIDVLVKTSMAREKGLL